METLETARLEDLEAVRGLNFLLRLDPVTDFYWDGAVYVTSAILEGRCYVIRDHGSVQGAMIIENRDPGSDYPSAALAIGTLAVALEARKKGIGIRLVEFAKALAFKQNKRLYVESFFKYRKLDFYTRLGFARAPFKKYNELPYHVFFMDPGTLPAFPAMKRITLSHRHEYLSYLARMPVAPSDVTFENLFLYNSCHRKIYLGRLNNNVIVLTKDHTGRSLYPVVGNHDLDSIYAQLFDWLSRGKKGGFVKCVPWATAKALSPQTMTGFKRIKDRDNFDYLYDPAALFAFDAPALRTQHQNLRRFMAKNPDFRCIPGKKLPSVEAFQEGWMTDFKTRLERLNQPLPRKILAEHRALKKAFKYGRALGLSINGVFLEDVLEGFSIHSIFGNTLYVHFEKATRQKGAYQSLVQKTAKIALNYKADVINREQDLGVPGLRTSKKRYLPVGFLEKCSIDKVEG